MLEDEKKVAVALLYDKINSPRVVAKGRDELADSILEIDKAADVPITEDYLFTDARKLELDQEIPESLFRAVAVVLAWVYRVQGKTPWDEEGNG